MSIEQLEAELMKLAPAERARLAERLLESLENVACGEAVQQAWAEEARRRYEEMLDGRVVGVPADIALRKARQRLG